MRELFRRLALRPLLAVELVAATLLVTLLNLASPLFVIQVLNRYVTFGFDGTLITLTTGMLAALVLLFGFRTVRTRIALAISAGPDERLAQDVYGVLARVKAQAFDRVSKNKAQEMLSHLHAVQAAYEGPNITAVLDAPFSLLYIAVALLLSPLLAGLGLLGMAVMLLMGWLSLRMGRASAKTLQELNVAQRGHAANALVGVDTVRAFQAGGYLRKQWNEQVQAISATRQTLASGRGLFQTVTQTVTILVSVVIYAIGAMLVVQGDMTLGALIGVNILTSRAIQTVSQFVQTQALLRKAVEGQKDIGKFMSLPLEADSGTALGNYSGRLEFKDVAFAFPGSTGPLFESLNLLLEPGSVLVVSGPNGSGKTTLARLVAGLVDPIRGEVLADGINLRQMAPPWWRRQIMYMPQEPTFLHTTIRENITLLKPDIEESELNTVINTCNLARFLFSSPEGLEAEMSESGRTLSLGVRRRLALARALVADGKLAVLDEPTEGLDAEGRQAVYALLNTMAQQGKTIMIMTHDPNIVKGATLRLDLGVKPVPVVDVVRPAPSQSQTPKAQAPQPKAPRAKSPQVQAQRAQTGADQGRRPAKPAAAAKARPMPRKPEPDKV